jgi:hypothetical protein
MGMSKPKVTHRHTLFAELSDLSIDVCVCTAGHVVVVVIVGKLSAHSLYILCRFLTCWIFSIVVSRATPGTTASY